MRSEEWWWKRRGAAFRLMAMSGVVLKKAFLPAGRPWRCSLPVVGGSALPCRGEAAGGHGNAIRRRTDSSRTAARLLGMTCWGWALFSGAGMSFGGELFIPGSCYAV